MIKLSGPGIISTWRPYEEGGGGASMRASEKECETITVFGETVLCQHQDGFWESFSFSNCNITWLLKPAATYVDVCSGAEIAVELHGKTNTIADRNYGRRQDSSSFAAMQSTNEVGIIS